MKKLFFTGIVFFLAIAALNAQSASKGEQTKLDQTLATAVIGAVIALFGYLGKSILEWLKRIKKLKQQKYAFLIELNSLLNASNDVFKKQQEMRHKLIARLQANLKINFDDKLGYEKIITAAFSQFNEDDKDLHDIIRGYTIALFDLNTAMLTWLKKDYSFKTTQHKKGTLLAFAKKLNLLESHLYLWIAKYNVWIPNNPKHALVYLADEEHHGTSFPIGIEQDLENILSSDLL